jgi:hypothetical protein
MALTNHQISVIVVNVVFMFLATVVVLLRFWAKRSKSVKLRLDDHLMLVGLVCTELHTILLSLIDPASDCRPVYCADLL